MKRVDKLAYLTISKTGYNEIGEKITVDQERTIPMPVDVNQPHGEFTFELSQTVQVRQFEPTKLTIGLTLPFNLDDMHAQMERAEKIVREIAHPEIEHLMQQKASRISSK